MPIYHCHGERIIPCPPLSQQIAPVRLPPVTALCSSLALSIHSGFMSVPPYPITKLLSPPFLPSSPHISQAPKLIFAPPLAIARCCHHTVRCRTVHSSFSPITRSSSRLLSLFICVPHDEGWRLVRVREES